MLILSLADFRFLDNSYGSLWYGSWKLVPYRTFFNQDISVNWECLKWDAVEKPTKPWSEIKSGPGTIQIYERDYYETSFDIETRCEEKMPDDVLIFNSNDV